MGVNKSRNGQEVTGLGWGNGGNNDVYGDMGMGNMDDPELAHALALSMKHEQNIQHEQDEDALLQQALAMSMQDEQVEVVEIVVVDEPDEKESNICNILLRMPKNQRIERRFKQEHRLNDVANFVKSKDSSFGDIVFVCPPMNSYNDMDMTLEAICKDLNSTKLSFIVKENKNKQIKQDKAIPSAKE